MAAPMSRILQTTAFTVLAALALTAPAGAAPSSSPAAASASTSGAGSGFRRTHTCGTAQIPRAGGPTLPVFGGTPLRTVYLNRFGGTYVIAGSTTNSSTNTASNNVSANGQSRSAVIDPLGNGFNWTFIASCVREFYAPYNVRVVETEPTSGAYVEAVVGGDGTELGFGPNQLYGIAAADNFCGVTERGIAFSFSETHRGVPQQDYELCATIAHEVGHVLALEHETLAEDLMSYVAVADVTSKDFVDANAACGTFPGQPQSCTCGGSTTNSAARLRMYLGLRPTETVPPTVVLESPSDGDTVGHTFQINATVNDDTAVADVVFLIDQQVVGSTGNPAVATQTFAVSDLALGAHVIEVQAIDSSGNMASATANITVSADCGGCEPGLTCVDGECLVATGEPCRTDVACAGGQCATTGEGTFCTQSCDLAADTCPDGFACVQAGAASVCDFSGGGCCSAGGGREQLAGTALLMFGVGLLLVRRRRAARA